MPHLEILEMQNRRWSDAFYAQIPRSGKSKTNDGVPQIIVRRRRDLFWNFGGRATSVSKNGRQHTAVQSNTVDALFR